MREPSLSATPNADISPTEREPDPSNPTAFLWFPLRFSATSAFPPLIGPCRRKEDRPPLARRARHPLSSAMPTPTSPTTFAIIGAGFSGTLTAIHLARLCAKGSDGGKGTRIILLDRSGRFGPGLAYSTDSPVHYLNVPAGNMSAFEDEPGHFLAWAQAHQAARPGAFPTPTPPPTQPIVTGSFVPRGVYGEYLSELLETAQREQPGMIETIGAGAAAVRIAADGESGRSGAEISTTDGRTIRADRVVLAFGNALPAHPPHLSPELCGGAHAGYIASPWNTKAIAQIRPDEPVFIVGTGLTMVDIVMQLHAQGHAGHIIALSRRGLLPRAHRSPSRPPTHRDPPAELKIGGVWKGDTRSLLRIIRAAVREHAARSAGGGGVGGDWRDVITSLRPITAHLWKTMSASERERFLVRLRSFWEVVRHRAAPESAAMIADLIAARQLTIRAGRCMGFAANGQNPRLIDVRFRPRGSGNVQMMRVGRVINAMGPQTDIEAIDDPLIRQLRTDGLITRDAFGTGIECADSGAVIGAGGEPSTALFAIGPMRKSQTWENTAVPELKKQAAQVAAAVVGSLVPVRR